MKFEDYIKDNKEKLQPKINKEALWSRISNELPPANYKSNYRIHFFVYLFLFVFIILPTSITLYYGKKNSSKPVESTNKKLIAQKLEINELIRKEETSSRILAVSMSQDIESNDREIVATLIQCMLNDPSPNVQLAAIRALEQHLEIDAVRVAMIEALGKTNDSYLQIKLIDLLSNHKEKRLLPYLDSIISNYSERSIVLDRAERSKKILKEL